MPDAACDACSPPPEEIEDVPVESAEADAAPVDSALPTNAADTEDAKDDSPVPADGAQTADADPAPEAAGALLALKEGKPLVHNSRPSKAKKKKQTVAAPVPQTKDATIDMITAKLRELDAKKGKDSADKNTCPKRQHTDPMAHAALLYSQGGEDSIRASFQRGAAELRRVERELVLIRKKNDQLTKERDRIKLDKTESQEQQTQQRAHCLELQRQIKTLKEKSAELEKEKDAQREDLEAKFQNAISEITGKLHNGSDDRDTLKKENEELDTKVSEMEKKCQERFDSYQQMHDEKSGTLDEKKGDQMGIERDAAEARVRAQTTEDELMIVMRSCQDMKMQIQIYKEKMGEFQGTITKSQDVFETFGRELERMRDHVNGLEKERDQVQDEISDLEKQFKSLSENRLRLRKQSEQTSVANQKLQSVAKHLNSGRGEWKPFQSWIDAWIKRTKPERLEPPKAPAPVPDCPTDSATGAAAAAASASAADAGISDPDQPSPPVSIDGAAPGMSTAPAVGEGVQDLD